MRAHVRHLTQALSVGCPPLFAEHIRWAHLHHGGSPAAADELRQTLQCLKTTIHQVLPEPMGACVDAYLAEGRRQLRQRSVGPTPAIVSKGTHVRLAWRYLAALLEADRHTARRLVREAIGQGLPVRAVYRDVFRPVQLEIGRLWQINELTVAQEHFCTAVTQALMAELYPLVCSGERNGRRLVAACIGGDLHELGLRMVADVLEMSGWDVHYLGANVPLPDIVATALAHRPNVLGVSVTMPYHLDDVRTLITLVRDSDRPDLPILVGGYPFGLDPALWQTVGADGYAPDADAAVRVADALATS